MLPSCGTSTTRRPDPENGAVAQDLLPPEPVGSVQPPVVEDLRGVPAQVRVHPPGLVEQQPGALGHRRPVAEDVTERRDACPGGCAAWLGWASCCGSPSSTRFRAAPADGQDVGQRHLARLVDEQGVHAARQAAARPQPDGARGHVELAVAQARSSCSCVIAVAESMQERVVLVRPLADPRREPPLARALADLVDQVAG